MNNSHPLVSVIIPHWNNFPILEECLKSLEKTSYHHLEIIVVDNSSDDKSPEKIKTQFPNVKLIKNPINEGYAGGCNRGVSQAEGHYIIFLNNDTTHEHDWISLLVNCMEKNKSIGALQPKILNYFNNQLFDYAGGSGGHMDVLCFPFARGRIFLEQEIDKGQYNTSEKIFWASGTAIMVRKNIFERAGMFDKTFFAHMEEIDLCWKLYMMGYEVWSEPTSVVYHKNAMTLPMYSIKKYYLNHRNSLFMLCSNYSFPLMAYILPLRIGLEIIAFFYALSKLDWKHMSAIIMSLLWLISHPHLIIKKRKHNKSIKTKIDKDILKNMFKGSIVVAYYLMREKTYGEISSNASS